MLFLWKMFDNIIKKLKCGFTLTNCTLSMYSCYRDNIIKQFIKEFRKYSNEIEE